eukprot:9483893-Pyramimonas_sp.AAC.2
MNQIPRRSWAGPSSAPSFPAAISREILERVLLHDLDQELHGVRLRHDGCHHVPPAAVVGLRQRLDAAVLDLNDGVDALTRRHRTCAQDFLEVPTPLIACPEVAAVRITLRKHCPN